MMIQDSVSAEDARLPDDQSAPWRESSATMWNPGDDGTFDLARIATWPGRTIGFFHSRYGTKSVPVPAEDATDVLVVFERATGSIDVTVRVRDALGKPVSESAVLVWGGIRRPDERGEVEVAVDARLSGSEMVVIRPGHVPVERLLPTLDDLRRDPAERTIDVVVDRLGATIRGTVVDEQGNPMAGCVNRTVERTAVRVRRGRGDASIRSGRREFEHGDERGRWHVPTHRTVGPSVHGPRRARRSSSRRGGPRRSGGHPRPSPRHPVRARVRTLRGRVEDLRGDPVPGAHVRAEARLLEPQGDPRFESGRVLSSGRVTAKDDGTFEIDGLVPDGVRLRADYRGAVAVCDAAEESLVLAIDVPCTVLIQHGHPTMGHSVAVVDDAGDRLRFSRVETNMVFSGYERYEMADEVAETKLHVSQRAREIRLMDGERVLARAPVVPDRHGTLEVEL